MDLQLLVNALECKFNGTDRDAKLIGDFAIGKINQLSGFEFTRGKEGADFVERSGWLRGRWRLFLFRGSGQRFLDRGLLRRGKFVGQVSLEIGEAAFAEWPLAEVVAPNVDGGLSAVTAERSIWLARLTGASLPEVVAAADGAAFFAHGVDRLAVEEPWRIVPWNRTDVLNMW